VRLSSAVAISSMRPLMATAPVPCNQEAVYWTPTEIFFLRLASVKCSGPINFENIEHCYYRCCCVITITITTIK
jgi:hypothetical protein